MCLPAALTKTMNFRKNTAGSNKVVLEWTRTSEFQCRTPAGKGIQIPATGAKVNFADRCLVKLSDPYIRIKSFIVQCSGHFWDFRYFVASQKEFLAQTSQLDCHCDMASVIQLGCLFVLLFGQSVLAYFYRIPLNYALHREKLINSRARASYYRPYRHRHGKNLELNMEVGTEVRLHCSRKDTIIWKVYDREVSRCEQDHCENLERKDYVATVVGKQSGWNFQLITVEIVFHANRSVHIYCLDNSNSWPSIDSWIVFVSTKFLDFSANNQSHELSLTPGSDLTLECRRLIKSDSRMSYVGLSGCKDEANTKHGKVIPLSVSPCTSDYMSLKANISSKNSIVAMGSSVVFTCSHQGGPESTLTLYRDSPDQVLQQAYSHNELFYTMSNISCGLHFQVFCMIDYSRDFRSMNVSSEPCEDKNITFSANDKSRELDVLPDSLVLFKCETNLPNVSEMFLYNNTISNAINKGISNVINKGINPGVIRFYLSDFRPGSSFLIGCFVKAELLTTYSELLVTVKQDNCCVGILVAAGTTPVLVLLGLSIYFIIKHRQKKLQESAAKKMFIDQVSDEKAMLIDQAMPNDETPEPPPLEEITSKSRLEFIASLENKLSGCSLYTPAFILEKAQ
ncbi:hypothetical protein Bpfe_009209 [Biomphalaria pfeifferi]|uniref:Ig-like domain-containing protein n=1 Tax=Biomphalaria pfeifferi TaxID=112525 RepID=A0AAD8BWD1_BIOPF|nr:hypothetical protein Bpfe_009209 [Biomphalaria pfeifferi]